ncbi:MAG: hypothetical protein IKT41_01400 [Clostridia bacterium]|nr:hypothetical protein [Clostridia bacterium]
MGDSLITVVAIILAAVLMFIFPLMSISDRTDDISQLSVQTATNDFVNEVAQTGILEGSEYDAFLQTLAATGNSFDVEMELKVLDENPGKKVTQAAADKIGENVYYSKYTSQLLGEMYKSDGTSDKMTLKEGDNFAVTVKNTNTTIAQTLRNFFYRVTGNDTANIAARHSAVVTVNGK